MSKARTLADFISDGSEFADGTISVAEVSGAAPLASPTFSGSVGIAAANPYKTLEIGGDLQLDQTDASIWLKSGATGTEGFVNWTFNTDDSVFAKAGIDYDTRATTGFHLDSGYPISLDASMTPTYGLDIRNSGALIHRITSGTTTFNELGNDHDFRVESDAFTDAIYVNAGTNSVSINGSGTHRIKTSNGIPLQLYQNSTNGDATLQFGSNDVVGVTTDNRAQIIMSASNNNAGNFIFKVKRDAGSLTAAQRISQNGDITFYQDDGSTQGLFYDASDSDLTLRSPTNSTITLKQSTNTGTSGIHWVDELDVTQSQFYYNMSQNKHWLEVNGNGFSIYSKQVAQTIAEFGVSGNYHDVTFNYGLVVNEAGADRDFRVESDSNANAFKVDAGENSGQGAVLVGTGSMFATGNNEDAAYTMTHASAATPMLVNGATFAMPDIPSGKQAQAGRWKFGGFKDHWYSASGMRTDQSMCQLVIDVYGTNTGWSNKEIFEYGFNRGWESRPVMVEVYEKGYLNGGYKKYLFHGGYDPSFTLYENYGQNSISLNVLTEGPFQKGTSSVSSSTVDQSYYRKTVRATMGAYYGGYIVVTIPSYTKITNNAEVDTSGWMRLLNPQ